MDLHPAPILATKARRHEDTRRYPPRFFFVRLGVFVSSRRKPAPAERGLSLLEVMIAGAILAIVVAITMQVLITGTRTYTEQSARTDVQDRCRNFLEEMTPIVAGADGATMSISADHTSLTFSVPVDWDSDGDVLRPDGATIEYGAPAGVTSSTPTLNFKYRYRFVQDGPVLNEAADKIDYNDDGKLTARVVKGHIEKAILNGAGAVVGNTVTVDTDVMLRDNPRDGDVNEDGALVQFVTGTAPGDPLFMRISGFSVTGQPQESLTGTQLYINIWHGKLNRDRKPVVANGNSAVRLQNVALPP